jgi:hypothetical protein
LDHAIEHQLADEHIVWNCAVTAIEVDDACNESSRGLDYRESKRYELDRRRIGNLFRLNEIALETYGHRTDIRDHIEIVA